MRILILCTGNSCRSQMAHGFLESFDSNLYVPHSWARLKTAYILVSTTPRMPSEVKNSSGVNLYGCVTKSKKGFINFTLKKLKHKHENRRVKTDR